MASSAATCSPSSLQLRLAFNCRKPPVVLVRMHVRKLDRGGRLFCAAQGAERRRLGSSWVRSDAAESGFSGWAESGGEEEKSPEYDRKKWFGGMLGAGLAGFILVGGLTFAAFSLSKQSNPRPKLQMEPLATEQQVALVADEQIVSVKDGDEGINIEQNDSSPENETGIDEDSPSSEFGDVTDIGSSPVHDVGITSNSTDVVIPEPASVGNQVKVELTNSSVSDPNLTDLYANQEGISGSSEDGNSYLSIDSSSSSVSYAPIELVADIVVNNDVETIASPSTSDNLEVRETLLVSAEDNNSSLNLNETMSAGTTSVSASAYPFANDQDENDNNEMNRHTSFFLSPNPGVSISSAGIPAPSIVSAALQVLPGKVLVPPVVDQVQEQALAALKSLKVIEAEVQPTDLCTRREYARWLVSASNVLSRNSISKVYPAMYIENVSELAFDDITPEDPDFAFIQGLAEAGLISSKLSRLDMLSSLDEDQSPIYFFPESPLARQDLVSWKMALEKRLLPEADRKILHQLSGFIDTDKIHLDACPALVADLSSGEQGIIALAFGYTRLFQPDKPVTKAQAAIALAIGEASDLVSEEIARIEAESIAENAVSVHNELVTQVKKDINSNFEKELLLEKEKIDVVSKMAEEARYELERLRAEREEDTISIVKERAVIDAEMEVLSKLRHEVEDKLQGLMSSNVEIEKEKEKVSKLRIEAENENRELTRLQYELEVERKALSMARAWADEEARRAREQAKALEEARDRWEKQGIKVVVDSDLREETEVDAGEQFSVQGTVRRAKNLMNKLKVLAAQVKGKSKDIINKILQKIVVFISKLKEWASGAVIRAKELKSEAVSRVSGSAQELNHKTAEFRLAVKDGAKRVVGDCRVGVEKLTQKFKA